MKTLTRLFAACFILFGTAVAQPVTDLPAQSKLAPLALGNRRTSGHENKLLAVPPSLVGKPSITLERGDGKKPAPTYSLNLVEESRVYLFVHQWGTPLVPVPWVRTGAQATWNYPELAEQKDDIYVCLAPKGPLTIPGHDGKDGAGYHGLPHLVVFAPPALPLVNASVTPSASPESKTPDATLASLKTRLGPVLVRVLVVVVVVGRGDGREQFQRLAHALVVRDGHT
jgi:hypothetical protein